MWLTREGERGAKAREKTLDTRIKLRNCVEAITIMRKRTVRKQDKDSSYLRNRVEAITEVYTVNYAGIIRVAQGLGGVKRREVSRRPPRGASGRMRVRGGRGRVTVEGLEPRASAARLGEEVRSVGREQSETVAHASARRETLLRKEGELDKHRGKGNAKTRKGESAQRARESGGPRGNAALRKRAKARESAGKREKARASLRRYWKV
ncbi:hypothetical protein EDB84DRAFT_1437408 [Lactarius hengduanensis]|nr:hypothetical protein EDB84DRAFT_1437408 [Lactarius hengduanensis]